MGAGADGLGAAGGQGGRCCGSTMCRHDHGIHSQGVCGRTDVTHACHASRAHLVVTDSQCIKRMFGPGHLGERTSVCDVHFSRPCALEKSVTFTEGRGARPSTFSEGARPREICYIYRGSGGAPIYFFSGRAPSRNLLRPLHPLRIYNKNEKLADGHTPDYCGSTTPWSTWSTLFHSEHRLGAGNRAGIQNQPAG